MNYELSTAWTTALFIGVVWELVWKGLALWRAARRDESTWFVILLVVNTLGILPIIYLLTHQKEPSHEN